jgi:hypothetical protein
MSIAVAGNGDVAPPVASLHDLVTHYRLLTVSLEKKNVFGIIAVNLF